VSISKGIWEMMLGVLKNQLRLGEFKFGGRESDQFKYFKETTMNTVYDSTKKFFQQGVLDGLFEKCSCNSNLRHGWQQCEFCNGVGFRDKEED
jgi:hypothetical protein